MICIYHSRDLDGWMSGAIVKLAHPDVELVGWDYNMPIPSLDAEKHSEVVLVDVCFPKDIMLSLLDPFNVTWVDHHISAIKEIGRDGLRFNGIRDDKHAACELTWMHFFPDKLMPELVRLLGRYDCFGHKGTLEELKVLQFQYGARQLIYNVNTAYINLSIVTTEQLFDDNVCKDILLDGQAIYSYLCTEAKHSYKKVFPLELDGYKFACINQERFNPINFGINYHDDGYDGFACFWYDKGKFVYSLYNDNGNVDCSVIAKNRGGGGHKGASGFISDKIIIW